MLWCKLRERLFWGMNDTVFIFHMTKYVNHLSLLQFSCRMVYGVLQFRINSETVIPLDIW
jgi:hypothetical protein